MMIFCLLIKVQKYDNHATIQNTAVKWIIIYVCMYVFTLNNMNKDSGGIVRQSNDDAKGRMHA